jgi:superfamily II DNA or RNA helicase
MEALKLAIQQAVTTGFVDTETESFLDYRPSILTNEPALNEKVLSTLLEELRSCESFFFSVAFITSGGVASLLGTLLDLEQKGVKGKILVSEYLNFTEPEALRKLLQLKNVELKIARDSDFHSKGFLFTHQSYYTIIIGSSNITHGALTKNKEWNLKVTAHSDSELFQNTFKEFNTVFDNAHVVDEDYLTKYTFIHNQEKRLRIGLRQAVFDQNRPKITPNLMQKAALNNLDALRTSGKNKALLVSATGTGKTYLSAFDVASFKPKKMLFLVHRRNIAQKAMESFSAIIQDEVKMGLYSVNVKAIDADYIFSTVQTFSREEHLNQFEKDHFDYIVIDETHRANASTYQKIMAYFTPKFLLGMTATPERTDGLDVFGLFDYNIAYEIRLHDALAHEMLVPFHYYGIAEIEVDGHLLDEQATIHDLNCKDRVDHILQKLELYGTDDGIVRGLVFCSRQEECLYLSDAFNQRGFKTIALTGASSEDERSRAIDLLETDDLDIKLDYIFTVDIFNEGIDIPRVNQIVMLRPTQSAIIFVQQLGRGLRKRPGKSYVTVIDFIGNYQNNFLVPIALFGDKTFVKDNLRKLVNRPEESIIGASTIHFDRIVKERIFHSIDTGRLQEKRKLVEEYKLLKGKLGRIPTMLDFVEHGQRDPLQYVDNYNSFYHFLISLKEPVQTLATNELEILKFLSNEVIKPVRFVDVLLIQKLLVHRVIRVNDLKNEYREAYGVELSDEVMAHAVHHINGGFVTVNENGSIISLNMAKKWSLIRLDNGEVLRGETLHAILKSTDVKEHLNDFCQYSVQKLSSLSGFETNDFIRYQRYSRKDTFRILRWHENPVAQNVGGYMGHKDKRDCALFVNYHKEEGISASTKYHDRFLSRKEFAWMSKNKRKLTSPDVQSITSQINNHMRIPLLVKKSNTESGEFYFIGDLIYVQESAIEKLIPDDKGKQVSVVEMNFVIDEPVEKSLFDYLVNSN